MNKIRDLLLQEKFVQIVFSPDHYFSVWLTGGDTVSFQHGYQTYFSLYDWMNMNGNNHGQMSQEVFLNALLVFLQNPGSEIALRTLFYIPKIMTDVIWNNFVREVVL